MVARRDIACRIVPSLFLYVAALDSGLDYFNNHGVNDGNGDCEANETPIWCCLASWLSWTVIGYCDQVLCAPQKQCTEISVPLSFHFRMHRYGERFMLTFGESMTSLLVVEGNNEEIYHSLKFYSGVRSVICMAHLHFQSELHHDEDHALTRSKHSNYLYTVMVPVYSMTLIATGMIL